ALQAAADPRRRSARRDRRRAGAGASGRIAGGGGRVRSIAQARRALAAQLRDAGLDSPELDARILIGHALGMDHTALVAAAEQPLGANAAADIARLAARRLAGEPV